MWSLPEKNHVEEEVLSVRRREEETGEGDKDRRPGAVAGGGAVDIAQLSQTEPVSSRRIHIAVNRHHGTAGLDLKHLPDLDVQLEVGDGTPEVGTWRHGRQAHRQRHRRRVRAQERQQWEEQEHLWEEQTVPGWLDTGWGCGAALWCRDPAGTDSQSEEQPHGAAEHTPSRDVIQK